ncbi:hypothetical protein CAJAP_02328 [Camponotus japonicus]
MLELNSQNRKKLGEIKKSFAFAIPQLLENETSRSVKYDICGQYYSTWSVSRNHRNTVDWKADSSHRFHHHCTG